MLNLNRKIVLVPLVLFAHVLVARYAVIVEHRPAPPDFSRIPLTLGDWEALGEESVDVDAAGLNADRLFARTYVQRSTGATAHLFVAWFQSQGEGQGQPHSPKVCLPGSGWTPTQTHEARVETDPGTVNATVILASKGIERATVLYWYQVQSKAVPNDWDAKVGLIRSIVEDRRSDLAFVRIIVPGKDDGRVLDFAKALYPKLRELLPLREQHQDLTAWRIRDKVPLWLQEQNRIVSRTVFAFGRHGTY